MRTLATLLALFGALLLARAGDAEPRHPVVSYLVCAGDPPDLWAPDPPVHRTPCDWRIYDPASGRDFSFVRLSGWPTHIRWDASFAIVQFKVGRDVLRAPWGPHATPAVVVRLPVDSSVCEFWRDPRDASWNYVSDRWLGDLDRRGGRFSISSAEAWRSVDGGAHWTPTRRDSCLEVSCGCVAPWLPAEDTDFPNTLVGLRDSMQIEHHPYRILKGGARDPDSGEEALVATSVRGIPGGRLEFMEGFGDSDHAKLPLRFVNAARGIRTTISAADTAYDDDLGQIGFRQEGPYLLVAGEYGGANARVADLRTGRTRFHAPRAARCAVWTPWPE